MFRFNQAQIDRLSELISNLSLVVFASLVLPVFSQQQYLEIPVLWMGGVVSLGCAILSLLILKGVKQ
jgi:hypothetical protein